MAEKATGSTSVPNSENGEETPKTYVTAEQVAQIVNSAITSRNRSFEEKLNAQFNDIKSLFTPKEEQQVEVSKSKKQDPDVQVLQSKIKAMEVKEAKARDSQLRTAVKEQLMQAGVTNPSHLKALVALHVDADKSIGYSSEDSEEIVYKTSDNTFTLKEGISNWSKSEDAKVYLAPRGVQGSGDKSYSNISATKNGKTPSRLEVGSMLESALLNGMKE